MNVVRSLCTVTRRALLMLVGVVVVLLTAATAVAQVSVHSEISPKSGHVDDLFLFTVTISGARKAPPPVLTDDSDFEVTLLGPRTSISIVNGVMNARISYVYHLAPRREGSLRTPKATVSVEGETMTVTPLEVPVRANHAKGDPVHQDGGDLLFLRQTVSPTSAYEGQQIVHTLSLYTRVDLSDLAIEEPTNDGVWQETIADNQRSIRNVNRVEYTSVEALKALFPLRSGTITIPARKLKAKIPDQRDLDRSFTFDPFSDQFLQQFLNRTELKPVSVTSNELSLEVKPLPAMTEEQRKFAPPVAIVGPTSIRVEYPLDAVNTGETKTISVEVTSEGNLNTLKTLPLNVPPRFKVYEERPEVKTERRSGKLVTRKTFKYSLLSLSPGLTRIPGAKLTYFNPQTDTYEILSTSDVAFPVRGEDLAARDTQGAQAPKTSDAQSSATTVPTMAPLPIAPPLDYEEPGIIERISQYVSVQFAILILATVCGLGCLAIVATYKKPVRDTKEISTAALQDVTSMKDLEAFVRRAIASKLPRVSENSTMDELRARVAHALPDKNLALSISALLDDIEVYSYGRSPADGEGAVQTLKERLALILVQWRRN
ncbi:MAG: hypothetical protein RIS36_17 [Pseudomonadota bacterium]